MKELNQKVKVKFLRYSIQNAMGFYPYVVEKRNISHKVYQDKNYQFYYGRLNTLLKKDTNELFLMDQWKMGNIESQYRRNEISNPESFALGKVEKDGRDYYITHIDEEIEDPFYCSPHL